MNFIIKIAAFANALTRKDRLAKCFYVSARKRYKVALILERSYQFINDFGIVTTEIIRVFLTTFLEKSCVLGGLTMQTFKF